ncbi:MAG: hypothetical protein SFV15_17405 [Polyangiaceae bacterium]|nr:hypothetical protein [Polyangiaceae bacterium]
MKEVVEPLPIAFDFVEGWLPQGKKAAVCFSIDDVHPGRSEDHYDGGGDLGKGALGLVERLLEKHPALRVTLFTTADWREISPAPSRVLSRIPWIKDHTFLTRILPEGARALDRHPEFVSYLKSLPRTAIAFHGLHHIHRGQQVHVEFQSESMEECALMLAKMVAVFERAGLPREMGMCPPGWNAPDNLLRAMAAAGLEFVASARDILSAPLTKARAKMSGLRGVPLFEPGLWREPRMAHIPVNFQATSTLERARAILNQGGLLSIKAHIIKNAMGFVALDGVDATYMNYLDALFTVLAREYGESLWWATMGEVSTRVREVAAQPA